jgi:hypothetical protein
MRGRDDSPPLYWSHRVGIDRFDLAHVYRATIWREAGRNLLTGEGGQRDCIECLWLRLVRGQKNSIH